MSASDWQYFLTHFQFRPEGGSIVKQLEACRGYLQRLLLRRDRNCIQASTFSVSSMRPPCPPPLLSPPLPVPLCWEKWDHGRGALILDFFPYPQRVSLLNTTSIGNGSLKNLWTGIRPGLHGNRAIFSVSEKLWLVKCQLLMLGLLRILW